MCPAQQPLIPLRKIPLEIVVDDVRVCGEILYLYPNDIEVAITHPFSGTHTGLHVPWFGMAYKSRWLATLDGKKT